VNITVKRFQTVGQAVFGKLQIDGNDECYTLEHLDVILSPGTFPVELTFSPRFQKLLPLLDNTPNRSDIRIHSGNWPRDSEGCILVGTDIAPDSQMILSSRLALDPLVAKIQAALDASEPVTISIS
jgi:hypothetical protein